MYITSEKWRQRFSKSEWGVWKKKDRNKTRRGRRVHLFMKEEYTRMYEYPVCGTKKQNYIEFSTWTSQKAGNDKGGYKEIIDLSV